MIEILSFDWLMDLLMLPLGIRLRFAIKTKLAEEEIENGSREREGDSIFHRGNVMPNK